MLNSAMSPDTYTWLATLTETLRQPTHAVVSRRHVKAAVQGTPWFQTNLLVVSVTHATSHAFRILRTALIPQPLTLTEFALEANENPLPPALTVADHKASATLQRPTANHG